MAESLWGCFPDLLSTYKSVFCRQEQRAPPLRAEQTQQSLQIDERPCCMSNAFPPLSGTSACYENITQQVSIVARLSDKSEACVMTAPHRWISSCNTPWDQMKAMQTPPGLIISVCVCVCICVHDLYKWEWQCLWLHAAIRLFMERVCIRDKPQDASRCSACVNPQRRSEHLPTAGFSYWPQPSRECQMERRGEGGGCFVWKLSAWDTMPPRPETHLPSQRAGSNQQIKARPKNRKRQMKWCVSAGLIRLALVTATSAHR